MYVIKNKPISTWEAVTDLALSEYTITVYTQKLKALTAPKGSILSIEMVGTLFKFLKTKIVSSGEL